MVNNSSLEESEENITVDAISIANPAFCSYLVCVCILILKMMATTLLTVFYRMRTKSFINDEDANFNGGQVEKNENVERTRRAYQNDMENIPLFCIISFGYLWTRPPLWLVNIIFIIYVVTRTLHTIVYAVYIVRQPARSIFWILGFLILGYMSTHTGLYAYFKLIKLF